VKLLLSSTALNREILGALTGFNRYIICTAWASDFQVSQALWRNRAKIQRLVVGLHFYQTDPEFIAAFRTNQNTRFVLQPDGTFHPKIYFFENAPDDWACIVGSANFTRAAFSINTEACIWFDSSEPNAAELRKDLLQFIETQWSRGKQMTLVELQSYRLLRKRYQPLLGKIAGKFGTAPTGKTIIETKLANWTWPEFVQKLNAVGNFGLAARLPVLSAFRGYFSLHQHFSQMPDGARRRIAGIAADGTIAWRLFGSMQGAGTFKNRIISNNPHVSAALDQIASQGTVTRKDYVSFLKSFARAFPNGGYKVAVASRLLAMKRPDIFLCIDSQNRTPLSQDLGIRQSLLAGDFDCYWDDVIQRIQDTSWWNAPRPKDSGEAEIWDGRTAMLDAIYYDP
jgi:hypothetical protein